LAGQHNGFLKWEVSFDNLCNYHCNSANRKRVPLYIAPEEITTLNEIRIKVHPNTVQVTIFSERF